MEKVGKQLAEDAVVGVDGMHEYGGWNHRHRRQHVATAQRDDVDVGGGSESLHGDDEVDDCAVH